MKTEARGIEALRASIAPFLRFFDGPVWSRRDEPDVSNFAVGNPQEMPLPGYVASLARSVVPQDKDWFAYKMSEPDAQATAAASMSKVTGLDWDPQDINMTNGGFAAIAVALQTLLNEGDEAIFLSPPWFFYEQLILAAGGVPRRVKFDMPACDLDIEKIEAAITPRTRVLLINSPHNPSGRIIPLHELRALASMLEKQSQNIGHPIFILSDEPYRRILFDGNEFHSPAEVYPHTVVTYSYGKQLLAPGMRIGYLTWPSTLDSEERRQLRDDTFINQLAAGYAFPNALLQHSLEELEPLCIDLAQLERRRERLVNALRTIGYEATWPEGTFYVMARSPIADDEEFGRILAKHKVLILPGTIVETPGWFRISLTASDEMVERGIPGFEAAYEEASR